MTSLFHYTCDHGAAGIRRDGFLRPHRHPWLPTPVVWLTDLEIPLRAALGLTSYLLACDRTAHRFEARDHRAVTWSRYCREAGIAREMREELELTEGAMPAHWWVATEPVPVCWWVSTEPVPVWEVE